jgi:hypothetical protein
VDKNRTEVARGACVWLPEHKGTGVLRGSIALTSKDERSKVVGKSIVQITEEKRTEDIKRSNDAQLSNYMNIPGMQRAKSLEDKGTGATPGTKAWTHKDNQLGSGQRAGTLTQDAHGTGVLQLATCQIPKKGLREGHNNLRTGEQKGKISQSKKNRSNRRLTRNHIIESYCSHEEMII